MLRPFTAAALTVFTVGTLTAQAPEEKPTEPPRVKKWKQVVLDRKPSTVLALLADHGPDKKTDPLDAELEQLRRAVVLGRWRDVGTALAKLPAEEARALHAHIVQSLPAAKSGPTPDAQANPRLAAFAEKTALSIDDLLGVVRAAPAKLKKEDIVALAPWVGQILASGVVENLVARLQAEPTLPLSKLEVARLLTEAGQSAYTDSFLPSLKTALSERNDEALHLLAQHFLGQHARDKKTAWLEDAWTATQGVLTNPKANKDAVEPALRLAVELAPKLKESVGKAWLIDSFTRHPQRGREILAAIGASVGKGIITYPQSPDLRHKALKLQQTAVETLLAAAAKDVAPWTETLTLLAVGWLKEAGFSHANAKDGRLGPKIQRDRFGNYFFYDDDYFNRNQPPRPPDQPLPIEVGDILDVRPSAAWIGRVDAAVRPRLSLLVAQLYLKAGEEADAFPHIEALAKTHQEKARELVHEFLRVWTRNHDLNENRRNMNPFFYSYGFLSRAESIPLTRSKQERNLRELTEWVARLHQLAVGPLDEDLLAKAFTASHSNAEVFRVELVEQVFGPLGGLKPKALASILQRMRENLGSTWREPGLQKDKKTNRKQKDIEAEVLRGYQVTQQVTEEMLRKYPNNWELLLVRAALAHDENNYRQEIAKSADFSARRQAALRAFQAAADAYAAQLPALAEDEHTTLVYEQWFSAGLGACDLGQVSDTQLPEPRQPGLIRQALTRLPSAAAEAHQLKFVNAFVTRMGSVKAPVKYRYLKAGLDIVGAHPFAHEARKTFDYYKDLITEIRLDTSIDGSDVVGHGKPFGVFVTLRHTREIERESGGFSRYLQNQNQNLFFAYNFGRPTTDYRDRFQTMTQEALKEHFEVLSVTFHPEAVHSRATREYGWRITPYAYLLLKARGPQVDRLPALKLDLDFLDTAGYVVLPIESAPLPLDAAPVAGQARPVRELQITQTLDERQADKGKLLLEIKALGRGLIPELEQLVAVAPAGFDVVRVDDPGVSVARYDAESAEPAVLSERLWTVTLAAHAGQQPRSFAFAKAKVADAKMTYQRFQDADLINATEQIDLDASYGKPDRAWLWWLGGGGVVCVALGVVGARRWRRRPAPTRPRFELPSDITPFTVLQLLGRLQQEDGLRPEQKAELAESITTIQRRYFAAQEAPEVNLRQLAEKWLTTTQAPES